MAFTRILVALTHHGADDDKICAQAVDLAQHEDSVLHLVSYVQWTPPSLRQDAVTNLSAVPDFDIAALDMDSLQLDLKRTRDLLTKYQGVAIAAGVETVVSCDVGDPGMMICETAKEWKADLVLVGRRGRSGLSELVMGSVSNAVVHHAPCSVLVIQGDVPEV